MKKEQLFGIIRHALTVIGGGLVAKGYLEDAVVQEIIGILVSTAGVIWSFVDKNKKEA